MLIDDFKIEQATVNRKNIRQYCNILSLDLSMFSEFERQKIEKIYSHDFDSNPSLVFHLKQHDGDDKLELALFYVEKNNLLNVFHICYLFLDKKDLSESAAETNMCKILSELVNKHIEYSFS